MITVINHRFQNFFRFRIVFSEDLFFQISENFFFRRFHFDGQKFLFFAPVQSQNPVSRNFAHSLFIIIFINRLFFFISGLRSDLSFIHGHFSDIRPVIRRIRNHFCQNIFCAVQRFFSAFHALFLRNISFSFPGDRFLCHLK